MIDYETCFCSIAKITWIVAAGKRWQKNWSDHLRRLKVSLADLCSRENKLLHTRIQTETVWGFCEKWSAFISNIQSYNHLYTVKLDRNRKKTYKMSCTCNILLPNKEQMLTEWSRSQTPSELQRWPLVLGRSSTVLWMDLKKKRRWNVKIWLIW